MVAEDLDELSFFEARSPDRGFRVDLRGVGLVGSFIDLTLNVTPDSKKESRLRKRGTGSDRRRNVQAFRVDEVEAHEAGDGTVNQNRPGVVVQARRQGLTKQVVVLFGRDGAEERVEVEIDFRCQEGFLCRS